MPQRLILCLDGTWNNRDDSTNVLHHFNLVVHGPLDDGWIQRKEYQAGVGTGPLDRITGGGFGFGLEDHVRDGYNWLVQNYEEGDEIYIFGFSRGAFTARSLVGFIGMCGLLRRSAPLTVGQLWGRYCELGRELEERPPVSAKTSEDFRRITDLVWDPWLTGGEPQGSEGIRGQRDVPRNDAERLLMRWSRRAKITYLGVYDTVGAIGWDALAFPGLKSGLALHHNLRPTTIIQNCRHALALQEHRSSFNHTPFAAFHGGVGSGEEKTRVGSRSWEDRIEQRWFAGAHSNVGGGYDNNRLSERPFAWMLEGAVNLGLRCETRQTVTPVASKMPLSRDSYAEFAPPLWAMILRAKRNYRLLDPSAEERASLHSPAGFSLQTIHETVDDSVLPYFAQIDQPLPPNLFVWTANNKIPATEPRHSWFGDGLKEPFALSLWASLAGVGFVAICKFVLGTVPPLLLWLACVIAFSAPIVDWVESLVNFRLAMQCLPWRRAMADSIYWTRAFLVVFFFLGAVHFLSYFWELGWNQGLIESLKSEISEPHWLMPIFAIAGLTVANVFDGSFGSRRMPTAVAAGAALAALIAAPAAAFVLLLVSSWLWALFPDLKMPETLLPRSHTFITERAALLLLLQFAYLYFLRAFSWVGEPLAKANLGSIVALQKCSTAAKVQNCLTTLRDRVTANGRTEKGTARLCFLLREALWRDILGFIPVYSLALGFGLWFAAYYLPWPWNFLKDYGPVWVILPVTALVADYIEDALHLGYLKAFEAGTKPALARLAHGMTVIKFIAFFLEAALTTVAIAYGTWAVSNDGSAAGWSGTAAVFVFGLGLVVIVLAVIKMVYQRMLATSRTGVRSSGPRPAAGTG